MDNRDRNTSQRGQGQANKPGQSVEQPERGTRKPGEGGGTQRQGGREGQRGSNKPAARPSPSGVPNEGRATRSQAEGYQYKGGRQSTGGIPNPDDPDDRKSAGSFRGTSEERSGDTQQKSVFRYPE
jgi:hypothetical protein